MMKQMAGQFGLRRRAAAPPAGRPRPQGQEGQGRPARPGRARGGGAVPAGMPDLSQLPPSLRELPPGLRPAARPGSTRAAAVPEGQVAGVPAARRCCSAPRASARRAVRGRRRACSPTSRCRAPRRWSTAGWIVPGLVDAHCHVGLGPDGAGRPRGGGRAGPHRPRRRHAAHPRLRLAGRHHALQARADLPEIIRAGRHLARPKRYIPGLARSSSTTRRCCPSRGRAGRGRATAGSSSSATGSTAASGDLAPLWPDDVLVAAIDGRARRRGPGHRARLRHRRPARPDPRRHRLHRARHRA